MKIPVLNESQSQLIRVRIVHRIHVEVWEEIKHLWLADRLSSSLSTFRRVGWHHNKPYWITIV